MQNYVANSLTREIIYTPPTSDEVLGFMKESVERLKRENDISPVLMAGVAQHRFVDIHPFLDGNGGTGRVLCTLILYQNGYDVKRLFSLSEFYDKNRREYYDAIQLVRESDLDMTAWPEYFGKGLRKQMLDVRMKGEEVIRKDIINGVGRNFLLSIKYSESGQCQEFIRYRIIIIQWGHCYVIRQTPQSIR